MTDPTGPLSFEELEHRLHDPRLTIVDVLSSASFEQRHLPGALSIPLESMASLAPELLPETQAEVAVYCTSAT